MAYGWVGGRFRPEAPFQWVLRGFEVSLKDTRADNFPASGRDNQEYYSNLLAAFQRVYPGEWKKRPFALPSCAAADAAALLYRGCRQTNLWHGARTAA